MTITYVTRADTQAYTNTYTHTDTCAHTHTHTTTPTTQLEYFKIGSKVKHVTPFLGKTGQSRTKILCLKLCWSSMSFFCTIHLKRPIAVKKHFHVNLCDFIGKTISQLLEELEPLFLGGYCHK